MNYLTPEQILGAGFSAISRAIEEAPMTWLPGFVIYAVESGQRGGCFQEGGASRLAAEAQEKTPRDPERDRGPAFQAEVDGRFENWEALVQMFGEERAARMVIVDQMGREGWKP